MAVDMKKILADGLLELCQSKPLASISIKDLLAKTGVSRQTFYNHFLDKDDLICYIYDSRVIPKFDLSKPEVNFRESLLESFKLMRNYHSFLRQACLADGPNSLKTHMNRHAKDFDLKWHQKAYGSSPMPEALVFATTYHAAASVSMTLSWLMADMPVAEEEIVDLITKMRSIGMQELFASSPDGQNPYKPSPDKQSN